eukprot:356093-Chlamydomonas_euryale.AAC.2
MGKCGCVRGWVGRHEREDWAWEGVVGGSGNAGACRHDSGTEHELMIQAGHATASICSLSVVEACFTAI